MDFDKLIDEAIDKLASESVSEGVEALEGIADAFAKAGYDQKSFTDLRSYIVRSAKEKAEKNGVSIFFIEQKIQQAERQAYERRTNVTPGTIITF